MSRTLESVSRLRSRMGGGIVVLTAFDLVQQSRDGAGPFLQEANFYWVTGIDEPGWKCIITGDFFYLVSPEKDAVHQVFEGGMDTEEALRTSGADRVLSAEEGDALLKKLSLQHDAVFTLGEDPHAEHYNFTLNPAPRLLHEKLRGIFTRVEDCRLVLSKLRAIKTNEEIGLIRKAIAYTQSAFLSVRSGMANGTFSYEYEIEAQFIYEMRRQGVNGHAYEPIVAGATNALTLHYSQNSQPLPKDGLVLMDVGARVGGYAADITRTYPIGKPSERERAVHAAVEEAHYRIIALIKPGVSLREYQDMSDDIMKDALQGLGLLEDRSDTETYRKYFPHAISHGLGIDVHESLAGYESFRPGMVLTVEPGIYIPDEGIGVRIEDDILVTTEGNENLSRNLPAAL
ncbi:aminopeptidase P N-terminal domain-containing protein [Candidatus Saccharibacteria bacterium TM7i]|nr:aminopeptidase P N-terminal domain-containing protein [Candidatus Saccharibacteria bacterium TM7i]